MKAPRGWIEQSFLARRAGIPYDRYVVLAMAVSGAFGGLAGTIMLQGDQYVLKDGFLVRLRLRRPRCRARFRAARAVGVVLGGLFFGFLRSGGINMEMVAKVPSAVVVIIQGLVIIAIAASAFWPTAREKRS